MHSKYKINKEGNLNRLNYSKLLDIYRHLEWNIFKANW